jgi:osmoprotectant transport system ATP-binding protein
VARFVGEDRGLKRLALRRLDEVELEPVPNGDALPECSSSTTLRDALSLMLTEGAPGVVVTGKDGKQGCLTFEAVRRLL